jgi:hypothetical protein
MPSKGDPDQTPAEQEAEAEEWANATIERFAASTGVDPNYPQLARKKGPVKRALDWFLE